MLVYKPGIFPKICKLLPNKTAVMPPLRYGRQRGAVSNAVFPGDLPGISANAPPVAAVSQISIPKVAIFTKAFPDKGLINTAAMAFNGAAPVMSV